MEEEEFFEKLNNNMFFTEEDLEELVFKYEIERIFEETPDIWSIPVFSIIQIKDKYYSIFWHQGGH